MADKWTSLTALRDARKELIDSKPTESGELARRYQVTITELEKLMGYFEAFVVRGGYWPVTEKIDER